MRRLVILLLFCIISLVGCSSKEELTKGVSVSKKEWEEENVWTSYSEIGFIIENKNDVATNIILNIKCYDENGAFVDERKTEIEALAPQTDFFYAGNFGSKIKDIEYDYICKKSSYKALDNLLLKGYTKKIGNDFLVSVKNDSAETTVGCYCTVVFYDDNQDIIKAETVEMHNGKVPSGEMVSEKISEPISYKAVDVFTNAYY